MRLLLQRVEGAGGPWVLLLAVNDSTEVIALDHRLLLGPNVSGGPPMPISAEPSHADESANLTLLNPWCAYGRMRAFPDAGDSATFHGYLVSADLGAMLPKGPADASLLVAQAEPLAR